jgi:hypothetical protein
LRQVLRFLLSKLCLLLFFVPKILSARFRRSVRPTPTVLDVIEGSRSFPSGRHAIFLIWQPRGVPWYVQNALDALATAQVNVLLVVNHQLSDARRAELQAQCARIMIRDNTGFDIGGFQDGTNLLRQTQGVERVMYLNDSVYFFRKGLSELFERLMSSRADVCSAFENWEIHYHFQSFCLSISAAALHHPDVVAFWRNYLPVNSRLWAINNGEVGFSRALLSAVSSIEVIYAPTRLQHILASLPKGDLARLIRYLPGWLRLPTGETTRLQPQALATEIADRVSSRSQIHNGGFLFRRFMKCPLMKRDLVYREQYSIYDIESMLGELGDEGHTASILTEMRRKGVGSQLKGWKRLQYNEGML